MTRKAATQPFWSSKPNITQGSITVDRFFGINNIRNLPEAPAEERKIFDFPLYLQGPNANR